MLSPNGFQAILFDLDGTLRHNRPPSFEVFLEHAARLGASSNPELRRQVTRWTHYYWAMSPELAEDTARFSNLNEGFWENYAIHCLVRLGQSLERAKALAPEMNRYMSEEHQPQDWIPEDVRPTLELLKTSGFYLGVLSNRDEPCSAYLEEVDLLKYLDLALVAGEVDAWKPDPRIFQHALQRLGVAPSQAVFVGDNYFADILGAQQAGLQPVLIDPDGLFPDADCPVIRSIAELPASLDHSH